LPQTLGAITKGKRRISASLSLRLGKVLDIDESYFMILQAYYDIEQEKRKQRKTSTLICPKYGRVFWDTDIDKLDWVKYMPSNIKRVLSG
jgi:plasmid maintenance system antidote protein VapI